MNQVQTISQWIRFLHFPVAQKTIVVRCQPFSGQSCSLGHNHKSTLSLTHIGQLYRQSNLRKLSRSGRQVNGFSYRSLSNGQLLASPTSASLSGRVRGDYAVLENGDLAYFKDILGKDRVLQDEATLESHNVDWTKSYRGSSKLLLRPKNSKEVSDILSYCNRRRLAVCPQGGNTGLVGGSVPVFDEIILSMGLMNKVIDLDTTSGILVCESGCVLEFLDDYVSNEELTIPLDLGARGSCHIGGNVATNAGGLRFLRYGSLHGNILGLEIVMVDGTLVECLSKLRKDNTGYDVKQLFIGSEGTLGVVTKVAIQCAPKSKSTHLAFLGCKSFTDVLNTYKAARSQLGEILSAFELIDQESLMIVQKYFKLRCPIEPVSRFAFYVLLETSGSNHAHDDEKVQLFVQKVLENGFIEDGGFYSQTSQVKSLWALRENITAATLKAGHVFKYDISLPLDCLYDVVLDLRRHLGAKAMYCNGFGHVGDSNIHINVTTDSYNRDVHALLEPYIFHWVTEHHGSISAEHGVGLQKRDYIHLCKSRETLRIMHSLKHYFDPNGILNPYKVLPLSLQ